MGSHLINLQEAGENPVPMTPMQSILRLFERQWMTRMWHTQFAELGRVDLGGGGTIAYIMANYGMEVIDSGVAVLNMHAPYEVSSKADVYEAVKGYRAFLKM